MKNAISTNTSNTTKTMKTTNTANKNLSIFNFIFIALWIALMTIIVWFSDQPDYVSQEQSLTVGKWLCNLVIRGFDSLSSADQIEYAKMLDRFVRKSAHFCEFAALGALTYNAFYSFYFYLENSLKKKLSKPDSEKKIYLFGKPGFTKVILSILWCAVFAASDEFHQLFVIGRYSSPLDVLLDTLGAATGIMFILLVLHIIRRVKSRRANPAA